MREPADPVNFFGALGAAPYRYDFYQALRRVECLFPQLPRIGQALRPQDEPVRLGQDPALTFAPASLSACGIQPRATVPLLQVRFLGLLGPNGPLPLHLTEFVRARLVNEGDAAPARFFDLINHRFLALFYRAWAQAQPTVSLDRPRQDRFAVYTGALFGLAQDSLRGRDALDDHAKLFCAGLLARQVRNRDGLVALLAGYFRLPVQVDEYVGHWMTLPPGDRSRLGGACARPGHGALLGRRVWDCQHKIRIRLGPLGRADYEQFLPGGAALPKLVAWVRQYLGFELDWDVRLMLAREQVPRACLGRYGRLGWTSWAGRYRRPGPAADLTLDAERAAGRATTAAAPGAPPAPPPGGHHGRNQPDRAVRQAEQPVLHGH